MAASSICFGASAQASPAGNGIPGYTRADTTVKPLPRICVGHALGLVNGVKETLAHGMDPTGRYSVGRNYPPEDYATPMLWDRNRATPLNLGGIDDVMHAVNAHGVAVGSGYGTGGWVYLDGKLHQVIGGEPVAINEKGQMVGGLNLWPSPLAAPARLPLPAGAENGGASDIDDDGTIVGSVGAADNYVPYVWAKDGTGYPLTVPVYQGAPLQYLRPTAVRNGWVVGYGYPSGMAPVAVRWDLATGVVEVFPEMEDAHDVNVMGWFVGKGSSGHALMSNGKQFKQLPDVFPFAGEFAWNVGYGISDNGRTMAGTVVEDQTWMNRAVKWNCL